MSETRIDEIFEQGDGPPEDRLIESVESIAITPPPVVGFVGYDLQGNELRYDSNGQLI